MGKVVKTIAPIALSVAFAAATGGVGSVTFLGLSGWSAIGAKIAASVVVSGLTGGFSSKPKGPGPTRAQRSAAQTLNFRSTVAPQSFVYGEARVGGLLYPIGSTANNKYLHFIVVLGGREYKAINEVWFDDDVIPNDALDGSGNVVSGKYAGKARIKKHLGTATETADSDLVSEIADWSSSHYGRGLPYLYIRLQADQKLFPNGAPNVTAVVQGALIYDSRIADTRWTPNGALLAYDYLTYGKMGFGGAVAGIGEAETESAANSCEEVVDTKAIDMVVSSVDAATDIMSFSGDMLELQRGDRVNILTTGTAPGGTATGTDYYFIPYQWKGTPRGMLAASLDDAIDGVAVDITSSGTGTHTLRKSGEPRYFGGGVVDSARPLGENLKEILSCSGGKVTNSGGFLKIFAAVYRSPSVTISESDMRAPLSMSSTRHPIEERFNTVKGIYVSPVNNWQAADYPVVSNATHVANDLGVKKAADIDLPFTQRAGAAQRLATIGLNQHRQELMPFVQTDLGGIRFQPCDTLMLTYDKWGFAAKEFEVDVWKLATEQGERTIRLGVDMLLRETAAGVYSWSSTDELLVDPAPNTSLPDPSSVTVVTGFSLNSELVYTQALDKTYKVIASWIEHEDSLVSVGGGYELQWKRSSESEYKSNAQVRGDVTSMQIPQLEPDVLYDIRIFAFNSRGKWSAETLIEGFLPGTTVTTDTEDWEIGSAANEDWEADSGAAEDWEA